MIQVKEKRDLRSEIIQKMLPLVKKPSRYLGNELNIIRKEHTNARLKVALCYPDTYEIGMSHQGLRILYHILNKRDDFVAERTYLPWVDMQEQMRKRRVPLYTLESCTPVNEFDLLGISLQTELTFTNVLNVLDLAEIPLTSAERNQDDSFVIGGGPCAFNPEPIADFFDLFLIGDAEELLLDVCDEIKDGRTVGLARDEILLRLAKFEGIYVPKFYGVTEDNFKPRPLVKGVPEKIVPKLLPELKQDHFPTKPLIPVTEVIHDRLAIEVARGCPRNCRFCQATILYRPARERSQESIFSLAREGIDASGYEEISPLSLSIADFSGVEGLLRKMSDEFTPEQIGISLPSLRVENFTEDMVKSAKQVRKSGLTFAPEGGSQRLRNAINKNFLDEDILNAAEAAFKHGWQIIKLYFMIGLPTENWEDLDELVKLVKKVAAVGKQYPGRKTVHVGMSPFVPKPHTPFQWERQFLPYEIEEKVRYVKKKLNNHPSVDLNWHDPKETVIDGIIARGDRRLSKVLLDAYRRGVRFDGWSEHLKFDLWHETLSEHGYTFETFTREKGIDEVLPWEFIDSKVDKQYLLSERERALNSKATPDCGPPSCRLCGVCDADVGIVLSMPELYKVRKKKKSVVGNERFEDTDNKRDTTECRPTQSFPKKVYRVHYGKVNDLRFISHLDLKQVLERSIRRAKLPASYSEGFNPHIKLSFSAPLNLGWASKAEYFDLELKDDEKIDNKILVDRIRGAVPDGLEIYEAKGIASNGKKLPSLMASIERCTYKVSLQSFPERLLNDNLLNERSLVDLLEKAMERRDLLVKRVKNGAEKLFDVRKFFYEYKIDLFSEKRHIYLLLENSSNGTVKPTEVLGSIFGLTEQETLLLDIEKTGSFILSNKKWVSPMDALP